MIFHQTIYIALAFYPKAFYLISLRLEPGFVLVESLLLFLLLADQLWDRFLVLRQDLRNEIDDMKCYEDNVWLKKQYFGAKQNFKRVSYYQEKFGFSRKNLEKYRGQAFLKLHVNCRLICKTTIKVKHDDCCLNLFHLIFGALTLSDLSFETVKLVTHGT